MGMFMSYMRGIGEGLAPKKSSGEELAKQTLTLVLGTLYDQFHEKEIKDFEAFHVAILDLFKIVNMAVPGRHYDPPPLNVVKEFFHKVWIEATSGEEVRKKKLSDFMLKNVNLNNVDETLVITGIVAPPAVMVVKKTGPIVPQLRVMKSIPDFIFVPSFTMLVLIVVKFSRIKFMKIVAPQ